MHLFLTLISCIATNYSNRNGKWNFFVFLLLASTPLLSNIYMIQLAICGNVIIIICRSIPFSLLMLCLPFYIYFIYYQKLNFLNQINSSKFFNLFMSTSQIWWNKIEIVCYRLCSCTDCVFCMNLRLKLFPTLKFSESFHFLLAILECAHWFISTLTVNWQFMI